MLGSVAEVSVYIYRHVLKASRRQETVGYRILTIVHMGCVLPFCGVGRYGTKIREAAGSWPLAEEDVEMFLPRLL